MKLITVHRILIGSAIAMFLLYGTQRADAYLSGDQASLLPAILSFASVAAFIWYYRWLRHRHPPRG